MSLGHLSRQFVDLIKNIGDSRSKQEEDKHVRAELRALKAKMKTTTVQDSLMRELCIRMIYVEMLGHEAGFGYIHAVNLSCMKNVMEKRVGYLASCLTLNRDHSLILLLTSTIQKDLQSDNFLVVSMALTVVAKLVNAETAPAIYPQVLKLLDHSNPNVRKKAIVAMNRFYELDPTIIGAEALSRCVKVLCDKDPSVMGASLILIENVVNADPSKYKHLTETLVGILGQIVGQVLGPEYTYHRVSAPWIQLKLLRVLARLGEDAQASSIIYPVLRQTMRKADIGINVGYAVVYECVRTAIAIFPDQGLLRDAAASISRFITSSSHNLKYLGINALAEIVRIDSKYAAAHQMTVIDCLEDPDETLRRKTLDLLYSMTNPQNVRVVMQKLIAYLRTAVDTYVRTELVSRITQIAENFAPDNAWYIENMNRVFELGGELVSPAMAHDLMNLIASKDVDMSDPNNVRVYAVNVYVGLLDKPRLPDVMLQVMAWVLGEYGHLSKTASRKDIVVSLCDTMESLPSDSGVRKWMLSAIMKLCAQEGAIPAEARTLVQRYQHSMYVSLQQRAHEFFELLKAPTTASAALPADQFGAEVKVDAGLSFLDGYVAEALKAGAKPYRARLLEALTAEDTKGVLGALDSKKQSSSLNFQAYTRAQPTGFTGVAPAAGGASSLAAAGAPAGTHVYGGTAPSGGGSGAAPPTQTDDASAFFQSSAGKWTESGFVSKEGPAAPTTLAPVGNPYGGAAQTTAPAATAASPFGAAAAAGGGGGATVAQQQQQQAAPMQRATTRAAASNPANSQKQQLALGLFAGVGPGAAATVQTTTSNPWQGATTVAQQAVVAPAVVAASPAASTMTAPEVKATQPGGVNLFDIQVEEDGGSAAPAPAPTAVAAGSGGGADFLDIFSSSSGAPQQTNAGGSAPAPSAAAGAGLDFLGGGLGGVTQPAERKDVVKGAAAMSATLKGQLAKLPKSPETVLVAGPTVYVSYQAVFLPGQTLCTVFITNLTNTAMDGAQTSLAVPTGMFLRCDADPKMRLLDPQNANTQRMVVGTLGSGQTATLMVGIFCQDPNALAAGPTLQGSIVSSGSDTKFQLPCAVKNLVRPAVMQVAEFGGLWKALKCEAKDTVATSAVTTPAAFMEIVKRCNLQPVSTIKAECIVAGKLVTGDKTVVPCLLHTRVRGNGALDFMARSNNPTLSKALLAAVRAECV